MGRGSRPAGVAGRLPQPEETSTTTVVPPARGPAEAGADRSHRRKSPYPYWFYVPAAVIYTALFVVPTFASFYFSLTRWTLDSSQFIGLDNYTEFFRDPQLVKGLINTFIYAVLTSGAKVVLGMALGVLLTSQVVGRGYLRSVVFFPVLVSTVGVGITFQALLNPFSGMVNDTLRWAHLPAPGWLTDPSLSLYSVAFVDIWKGVGLATVIYMAGIVSIPAEYREAARVDGANAWASFRRITLPLLWPATSTVIILSFIGGLRSFELIWAMTRGGPGFSSDVIASVIYKQYQAGFYGLSTAGNVILFVIVTALVVPLSRWLARKEVEL
ncbi:sugar ABC transporter permease [Actinoplanes sp. NPDC051411]|uniref:carbohydrate ABC transporter permease n=1 Tax=Actinoplanes sp. NPDC051411 TaxID=3155522 RepID=UPI00343140D3